MRWIFAAITVLYLANPAAAHAHRHHRQHGNDGRPHAWCGWFMRHQVGHDPGSRYNLARNWSGWGHATTPHAGAIVVWSHHVGKLIRHVAGNVWIVLSGNDGHAVRSRARSIGGAIAFRD